LSSQKRGAGIHPAAGGTAFAGVTAFLTFYGIIKFDELVKSRQDGWQSKKLQMPGAQILRNEAYLRGTPQ